MISHKSWLAALVIALATTFVVNAELKYVDAATLRIINKGWTDTPTPFSRIAQSEKDKLSSEIWSSSAVTSTGIAVRFATNSRTIAVKYTLTINTHMNHQAPTGTKGVDIYILDGDSVWRHANTLRPADSKKQSGTLLANLNGQMRDYMLYLPTYDGLASIELGIDDTATLTKGNPEAIRGDQKIVFYGSSILQGGCASRTGMAGTCILSRWLNCECVNLGFSGQATLNSGMDEALKTIQGVQAIVLDPIPNCDDNMIVTNSYRFIKNVRDSHPGVPVVMVEGPIYPYAHYQSDLVNYLPTKNQHWHETYIKLLADDPDNLYYVDCENLDGVDDDGTVDGIHLTDLGFKYWAEKLYPVLQPLVKSDRLTLTAPASHSTDLDLEPTFTWSDPSRSGVLQISLSNTFSAKDIVFETEVKGGSYTMQPHVLAACTKYYARLKFTIDDMVGYTPNIDFTTRAFVPDAPAITYPIDGGVLHSNERIAITPVDGVSGLRLEVCANTTFAARSTYISSKVSMLDWADGNTAADIKLGSAALKDGEKYYTRVLATYNTPDGSAKTDYSPIVEFTYSKDAGTQGVNAKPMSLHIEYNATPAPILSLHGIGNASIALYGIDGRLMGSLFEGFVDGMTSLEAPAPGQYIAVLRSASNTETHTLIVR